MIVVNDEVLLVLYFVHTIVEWVDDDEDYDGTTNGSIGEDSDEDMKHFYT